MMDISCPNCGNEDQERFETLSERVEDDQGKAIGQQLMGWRCMDCGMVIELEGPPAPQGSPPSDPRPEG